MIGIIDYGMGNLRSVQNALQHLGYRSRLICESNALSKCERVILPGVGAFPDCMKQLEKNGFTTAIPALVQNQIPLLGICLGMQVLFEDSEEGSFCHGLGVLHGHIRKMQDSHVKIPHIGWNDLTFLQMDPLLEGLSHPYVYYVHSFYACDYDKKDLLALSQYGSLYIPAIFRKNNVWACQFHPEKSGDSGLRLLQNFLSYDPKAKEHQRKP